MTLLELLATGFLIAIAGVGMCVVLAWVHVRPGDLADEDQCSDYDRYP